MERTNPPRVCVFRRGQGAGFTIVMEEVDGVDREVCLALDGDTEKNSGAKF